MPDPFDDRPKGRFDDLLGKLPGFAGYVKRDARRKSDELARQYVASHLEQAKKQLEPISRDLLEQGQIDALPKFDRLRGRLDFIIAKLRGAPAGFHAFFDVDELRDELLEDVYDHDLSLIAEANQFADFVESLRGHGKDSESMLLELNERWQVIETKIGERDKLLAGDEE